jgi:hypothetical protein
LILTIVGSILAKRKLPSIKIAEILFFSLAAFVVSFLWYGLELIRNGPWFLQTFIEYQIGLVREPVAGHGQPFFYHFVVIFIGCFPIAQFALPKLLKFNNPVNTFEEMERWMRLLFWTVILLFSFITTKIVHYSSMCYLPLSFLAASYIQTILTEKKQLKNYVRISLAFILFLLSTALTLLPIIAMNKDNFIPYIKDKLVVGNLSMPVVWGGWEWLIGLIFLITGITFIRKFKSTPTLQMVNKFLLINALCYSTYMVIVVPKIEQYSQGAAIQFYESLQGQDVYVHPIGFKSYAHLFYFKKPMGIRAESADQEWLMSGPIDKTCFLVAKVNKREFMKDYPLCKLIDERGGFLFYRREAVESLTKIK